MIKKTDINFNWKYTPNFKNEYILKDFDDSSFQNVQIPHTNIEVPYNNFDESIYQFESCYRKNLWIDAITDQQRVYIKFNGVMAYAKVYLNGNYIGEHKGGYTPFRLDLTEFAIINEYNTLAVYVDSNEREEIPPFGFVIDYLTYGGIYREVSLEYVNQTHIENVAITTKDVLTESPALNIDLYFTNHKQTAQSLICEFSLLKEKKIVQEFKEEVELTSNFKQKHTINEVVSSVALWSLDDPNLYTLKVNLILNNKIIDSHNLRFGFRDINFTSKGFYLNGEKLKLRGLNRHQSFPYVGYAMPKSAQYKDADILKYDLGLNIVRLSHYPQSDHFLDRCDEIGLLVFDEIPGWQHIGNQKWQDTSIENVSEMILKDINHPSVIIWGVRINESQDNQKFYAQTNAIARKLDDSRPTGGVRDMAAKEIIEDVYTYNDFVHTGDNQGLDKKKKITKSKKPYLITEYNGHMFPTKKFDNESRRISHALRHLNVLAAMENDDDISGAIGWCMFDYNTHKDFGSGDRICYHGVMDMFRIPKYAAYAYQSQQMETPVMHVASSLNIGEYDASLMEDIHVFTNCDYIKLYKNNQYINTFYPDQRKYKSLLHPPIIIDDLIGDEIENNEIFTPKDAETIKQLLIKVNKSGLNLNLIDTIKMGKIFLKYKLNMNDAEALYTKYFGGWGEKATSYFFEGYINDESVAKVVKSQVSKPNLKMTIDKDFLIEDKTYDVTRIVVELLDEFNNNIVYANDVLKVECDGPLEIIGPKAISLIGGSIGFWVKTIGESGVASVKITSDRFGIIKKDIQVQKF